MNFLLVRYGRDVFVRERALGLTGEEYVNCNSAMSLKWVMRGCEYQSRCEIYCATGSSSSGDRPQNDRRRSQGLGTASHDERTAPNPISRDSRLPMTRDRYNLTRFPLFIPLILLYG